LGLKQSINRAFEDRDRESLYKYLRQMATLRAWKRGISYDDDIEDAAQNVLVAIFKAESNREYEPRKGATFYDWASSKADGVTIDAYRKAHRRSRDGLDHAVREHQLPENEDCERISIFNLQDEFHFDGKVTSIKTETWKDELGNGKREPIELERLLLEEALARVEMDKTRRAAKRDAARSDVKRERLDNPCNRHGVWFPSKRAEKAFYMLAELDGEDEAKAYAEVAKSFSLTVGSFKVQLNRWRKKIETEPEMKYRHSQAVEERRPRVEQKQSAEEKTRPDVARAFLLENIEPLNMPKPKTLSTWRTRLDNGKFIKEIDEIEFN
jgi:RNA polymerase sigma factor (sigma-70 family)